MDELKELVLLARKYAEESPASAALSREDFVKVCTRSAAACKNLKNRQQREAALKQTVTAEIRKTALASITSPRTVSTVGTPRTGVGRVAPSSAGGRDAFTPSLTSSRSSSVAPKMSVLKAIKPYLDPAYRNGIITRDDYTAIALRLTDALLQRFPSLNLESTASSEAAVLDDVSRDWVRNSVQREIELASVGHRPLSTEPPEGSTSVRRALNLTEGGAANDASLGLDDGSPFERHLRKLREIAAKAEQGSPDTTELNVNRTGTTTQNSTDARRHALVATIAELQQRIMDLNEELYGKIQELRSL
jgi:hypothetical protein